MQDERHVWKLNNLLYHQHPLSGPVTMCGSVLHSERWNYSHTDSLFPTLTEER